MKHTPLGYDIVDGKAVINEEEAEQIKTIYAGYLLGLTMKASAKMAGLDITHSRVKNIMLQDLDKQVREITKYSESLVRRLIEKITVYDEKLVVEFKSGFAIEVDG